jgi:hypothetical protein
LTASSIFHFRGSEVGRLMRVGLKGKYIHERSNSRVDDENNDAKRDRKKMEGQGQVEGEKGLGAEMGGDDIDGMSKRKGGSE